MRIVFKPFFFEIGMHFTTRYSFKDYIHDLIYGDKYEFNECKPSDDDREIWEYNAPIEKRLHTITGYNIQKKKFDDRGELHWLFRDVDLKCNHSPSECLDVIDLVLVWVTRRKEKICSLGASDEQIDVFDKVSSKLFADSLVRIYNMDANLYKYITSNFWDKDDDYMYLVNYYNNHKDEKWF